MNRLIIVVIALLLSITSANAELFYQDKLGHWEVNGMVDRQRVPSCGAITMTPDKTTFFALVQSIDPKGPQLFIEARGKGWKVPNKNGSISLIFSNRDDDQSYTITQTYQKMRPDTLQVKNIPNDSIIPYMYKYDNVAVVLEDGQKIDVFLNKSPDLVIKMADCMDAFMNSHK